MKHSILVAHEIRRNWQAAVAVLALFFVAGITLMPLFSWIRHHHDTETVQTVVQLFQWGLTIALMLFGGVCAGYDARNHCGDATASLPVPGFRLWLAKYGGVLLPSLPSLILLTALLRAAPGGTWSAGIFAAVQALSLQSIVFQVTLGARSESNRVMFLGFSACLLLFLAGPVWYPTAVVAAYPVSLAAGWYYYTQITLRGRNAPVRGILAAIAISILIVITLGRFS